MLLYLHVYTPATRLQISLPLWLHAPKPAAHVQSPRAPIDKRGAASSTVHQDRSGLPSYYVEMSGLDSIGDVLVHSRATILSYILTRHLPHNMAAHSRSATSTQQHNNIVYVITCSSLLPIKLAASKLAPSSRACCHLQSLLPHPELTAVSRACCYLQILLPLDLSPHD